MWLQTALTTIFTDENNQPWLSPWLFSSNIWPLLDTRTEDVQVKVSLCVFVVSGAGGVAGEGALYCIQCIQCPVCRDPAAHHVCSAPGEQGNLILTSCLLCIDLCSLNDVWSPETQYKTLVCSNWIFLAPSRAQGVSMSISLLQKSFNFYLHLSLSRLSKALSGYSVGQRT